MALSPQVNRGSDLPIRTFWNYYGAKWRVAPHYPPPLHRTIIEPFAGAAGYACRYADHDVILVEKYAVIAEIWRYLIGASEQEIRAIPLCDTVDDLPSWVPLGARYLIGFLMNDASVSPRRTMSAGLKRLRANGRVSAGWGEARRERVASQLSRIRHWQIIEGDYTLAPDVTATWFIDPPYDNRAGRHYVHSSIDYPALGDWCQERRGQTIVCENSGAGWLPFQDMRVLAPSINGNASREAIWQASA